MLLRSLFLVCSQILPILAFLPAKTLPVMINNKANLLVYRQSKQNDALDVIGKFDLNSKFGRWKYLKGIIEEDIGGNDVNVILYQVLRSFVDNPRPRKTEDGQSNPSPELTEEQGNLLLQRLFQMDDGIGFIAAMPEQNEDFNCKHEEMFTLLEKLQPDPVENEDDFKSCWDILTEIYGREATKIAQQTGNISFKYRSSIVRLLIHYDFLTQGLGEHSHT
mmetsp:Transcript_12947/g.24329  ORF Transcript_12947/g.24329 Transcript_12947/m.24329 type:complete len:220 (+) Transcript_12947:96-755(+)